MLKYNNLEVHKINTEGKEIFKMLTNRKVVYGYDENPTPPSDWKLAPNRYIKYNDKYYEFWFIGTIIDNNPVIDLNGNQWVKNTVGTEYDTDIDFDYYMSDSNYHIQNSMAGCKVTWKNLNEITLLWCSNAEPCCDYAMIGFIDDVEQSGNVLYTFEGRATHEYDRLTLQSPDLGEHHVWVYYTKDVSVDNYDDRGFLGIPNNYVTEDIKDTKRGAELVTEYKESDEYEQIDESHIHYKYYAYVTTPDGIQRKTGDYKWGEPVERTPLDESKYIKINSTYSYDGSAVLTLDIYFYGSENNNDEIVYNMGEFMQDEQPWNGTLVFNDAQTVYIRNKNLDSKRDVSTYIRFFCNNRINVAGNVENIHSMGDYAYSYLFNNSNTSNIIDLVLPNTVAPYCYYYMFGFNSINSLNRYMLPATELADGCYYGMFRNCADLTTAPELPATRLAYDCYNQMFYECTNLTSITANLMYDYNGNIITDFIDNEFLISYQNGVFYKNPNWDGPTERNINTIPSGWLVIDEGKSPIDTDYWLKFISYMDGSILSYSLFGDANDIIYVTKTGADQDAYELMPDTDIVLNSGEYVYIQNRNHIANRSESSYMKFNASGYMYCYGNLYHSIYDNNSPYKFNSLFKDCQGLTVDCTLDRTELSEYCYMNMFENGGNWTQNILPADVLVKGCYKGMFKNNTYFTEVLKLPTTHLADECYMNMFENTNIGEAPKLPATQLNKDCYKEMFKGCANINNIKCNVIYDEYGSEITNLISTDWLSGVSETGTFVTANQNLSLTERTASTVPSGWTINKIVERIDEDANYADYSNRNGWLNEYSVKFTSNSAYDKVSLELWNQMVFIKFVSDTNNFNADDNIILNAFTRTAYAYDEQVPVRIAIYYYDSDDNMIGHEEKIMANLRDYYYVSQPSSDSWSQYIDETTGEGRYVPNGMSAFNYVLANTSVDDETGYINKFTIPQDIENGHIEIVIAFKDLEGYYASWCIFEDLPLIGTPGNYSQLQGKQW